MDLAHVPIVFLLAGQRQPMRSAPNGQIWKLTRTVVMTNVLFAMGWTERPCSHHPSPRGPAAARAQHPWWSDLEAYQDGGDDECLVCHGMDLAHVSIILLLAASPCAAPLVVRFGSLPGR
jgi:hypothetical protein